jgi:hypothetical protein
MKKIIASLLFIAFTYTAYSQQAFQMSDNSVYAVIKDNDGFVNVRKSPNKNAPVVGKIDNYLVFSCDVNKTDWWKASFIKRNDSGTPVYIEGFVHKSRVVLLPKWKTKINNLVVEISKSLFVAKRHKLSRKNNEVVAIDGKSFWGTDGPIPKAVISAVKISNNGLAIEVPATAFNDLYEPRLSSLTMTTSSDNTLYIKLDNSDGAGAYSVIWMFKDNKYYGRYIDDSNV